LPGAHDRLRIFTLEFVPWLGSEKPSNFAGRTMSRLTSTINAAASAALLSAVLAGCSAQSGPKKPRSVTPPNFESLTPPQSLLREDTIEAGTHDRSSSRLAYVGVWAVSGDACAMMDQTAFEGYAVITPGSLRHPDETCSFDAARRARPIRSSRQAARLAGRRSSA
jgi:hypothetical protein